MQAGTEALCPQQGTSRPPGTPQGKGRDPPRELPLWQPEFHLPAPGPRENFLSLQVTRFVVVCCGDSRGNGCNV